jgi:hypothetical protein
MAVCAYGRSGFGYVFFLGCVKRPKNGPAPDIDGPIQAASHSETGPEPSPDQISLLTDMGFTTAQARKALRETVGGSHFFRFPLIINSAL